MAEPEHTVRACSPSEPSAKPPNARSRAIRFTPSMDMAILACVNEVGAHIAPYGHSQKLFERATVACRAHPSFTDKTLTVKSVWDRFKKLLADFKKVDRVNRSASGITEEYGAKEELLQDIFDAIGEKEEQERAERGERRAAESRLLEAGENLRSRALNRKRRREKSPGTDMSSGMLDSETPDIDGMSRSDHDLIQRAEQRQERREELDIKRFALEESTSKLEQEKIELLKRRCVADEAKTEIEKERLSQDRVRQEKEDRRLELEEQRMQLEKEEREKLLALMTALVDKLTK